MSSQTDDATHKNRFFCLSQLCGERKNGSKIKKEEERRKIRIRTPIAVACHHVSGQTGNVIIASEKIAEKRNV